MLNSPLRPTSIVFGKMGGILGFVALVLVVASPAFAACFAMGGISLTEQILPLYLVAFAMVFQVTSIGLLVSSMTRSLEISLRVTYGLVVGVAVICLVPDLFFQGTGSAWEGWALRIRGLSPLSATMELVGQGGIGKQGIESGIAWIQVYCWSALLSGALMTMATTIRLGRPIFDRARSAGIITQDRSQTQRFARSLFFIVDPQRRKSGIRGPFNPVVIKEFRTRRFGRSHWLMRLVAFCAIFSMVLTYVTTSGTENWGVETVGGIMVLVQVAMILLVTPSAAAGLISSERETGGWKLLQMTPLSVASIAVGKLLSAFWTVGLVMLGTLPGYLVLVWIEPDMQWQVERVMTCLVLAAMLTVAKSAVIGSFFRNAALATTTAYGALLTLYVGTFIVWLGRDAPFGYSAVRSALMLNPVAAALGEMGVSDFDSYELVPMNWWIVCGMIASCIFVFMVKLWRLSKPE